MRKACWEDKKIIIQRCTKKKKQHSGRKCIIPVASSLCYHTGAWTDADLRRRTVHRPRQTLISRVWSTIYGGQMMASLQCNAGASRMHVWTRRRTLLLAGDSQIFFQRRYQLLAWAHGIVPYRSPVAGSPWLLSAIQQTKSPRSTPNQWDVADGKKGVKWHI